MSFFLFSCEQQEGERCQRNSDCASGLICCKASGSTPTASGVCKAASDCIEADTSTDTIEDTIEDTADVQDIPEEEAGDEVVDTEEEDLPQDEVTEEIQDVVEEDEVEEEISEDVSDEDALDAVEDAADIDEEVE